MDNTFKAETESQDDYSSRSLEAEASENLSRENFIRIAFTHFHFPLIYIS